MKKLNKFLPKLQNNFLKLFLAGFLILLGIILYTNLGRDALFDWDEGIYGELGRQLVVRGNPFTTYWNGEPWLEKPPGIAWLSAPGILLFGPTALGARLLQPLLALYTLAIVFRLAVRTTKSWQGGLIAMGVLTGFDLFLGRTRAVNTDMPLLASLVTTLLFLLENRPAWWVALSIFGGVWFKGIAGLLSLFIAMPLLINKSKTFILHTSCFVLLFVLPWHLYSYFRFHNEFLTPYFFEQVVRRATSQIEFHFESRWYYFQYLYTNLGLGVLLVATLGALLVARSRANYFLLWWVLFPLGAFTLAKTRLFWYILPIYPALAIMISHSLTHFINEKKTRTVIGIIAVGICLQGLLTASRSVEWSKKTAISPDRVQLASQLSHLSSETLFVLVPPSERLSEALLPAVARLSSSFRYGGMPSVVYYYRGPVKFFYDVDRFRAEWQRSASPIAMVAADDRPLLPEPYRVLLTTPSYLAIQKGLYANR